MNDLNLNINELKRFYKLPPTVVQAHLEKSVHENSIAMRILATLIIIIEIFNISRVLLFTNAKLSTLNNRIYFSLYVALLLSAIFFNLIERLFKEKQTQRMRLYIAISYFWMLWHVVLNCYDLNRTRNGDIAIFSCAVLILAIFARLKPRHTLTIITLAYLMLLLCSVDALDAGGYINATISLILACLVALRVYTLSIAQIYQHLEIAHQSDQLQMEQAELSASLKKYELVLNNTNDQIFEIDFNEERLTFAQNSRFAKRFGTEHVNVPEWLQTQNAIHPQYAEQLVTGMRELACTKQDGDYTFQICAEDGTDRWYRLRVFITSNSNDMPLHGLGIITDIDAQYRQVETLTSQTKTDPLTGLLNTMAFRDDYDIARQKLEENMYLVMFMLDLDAFKAINDTYGHFAGDCALKEVANVLSTTFRDYDSAARLGGDEFAIIMKNVKDMQIIKKKAEQLIHALSKIEVTEHKIHVTCSIGVAVTMHAHTPYDELYQCADKALYEAKGAGKACYQISQPMQHKGNV